MAGETVKKNIAGHDYQIIEFDTDENDIFDAAWEDLVIERHNERDVRILDNVTKELVRDFAQAFKNDTDGLAFEGLNPINGFGMRWAMPQDMMSVATAAGTLASGAKRWSWSFTVAADSANGFRNWMSNEPPNTEAFSATTEVRLRDTNDIVWAALVLGIREFATSSVVKSVIWTLKTKPAVRQYVEPMLRASSLGIARFGPIWIRRKIGTYAFGIEARGEVAAEAVTIDAMPLAIVFFDSDRGLQADLTGPIAV